MLVEFKSPLNASRSSCILHCRTKRIGRFSQVRESLQVGSG